MFHWKILNKKSYASKCIFDISNYWIYQIEAAETHDMYIVHNKNDHIQLNFPDVGS